MSTPKGKGKKKSFFCCEKCNSVIVQEEVNNHPNNCPPLINEHHFIQNKTLYGQLDYKINEDIKGLSQDDKNHLVFLSQACIQLCSFAIGELVIVSDVLRKFPPYARMVWPTEEKSLTSVLLAKNGLDTIFGERNINVSVSKITLDINEAQEVKVIANLGKLEPNSDLLNRVHKLQTNRLLTEGNKFVIRYYGKILKFEVKHIRCSKLNAAEESLETNFDNVHIDERSRFCKIVHNTKFSIFRNDTQYENNQNKINLLSTIGGLDDEISELNDLMNAALNTSKNTPHSIISNGVLLYGSSGSGKTLLVEALINESAANVIKISNMELYKNTDGNIEETITRLFADVVKFSPCIVVLDEIDLLCSSKSTRATESDKRIMSNLLNLFEYIHHSPDCKIFVIATTNKPDTIDPGLRRCGRFDREIEIPTPTPKGRLAILRKLLNNVPTDLGSYHFNDIAYTTHGFVGADLVSLCSRASLHAVQRGSSKMSWEDFKFALTRVSPSAMREVQIEVPNVKWCDIGGQEELKLILRQAVEWPLTHPDSFIRMGITPPRGVLMYGPPGCSKTMIAKALATQSSLNFISIKGPELFSKWVGESERAVREVFRKARQVAPSIIFFDEIDALGGERSSGSSTSVQERVLAQLLTELDGVTPLGDVTVLAATNRPDRIDKALLRPGRLDRIVYVPLPNSHTRKEILKIKLAKMPVNNVDLGYLIEATEGYSGAEVNALCHEAAMKALEENLDAECVRSEHFFRALELVKPRTPQSLIDVYHNFVKQ